MFFLLLMLLILIGGPILILKLIKSKIDEENKLPEKFKDREKLVKKYPLKQRRYK